MYSLPVGSPPCAQSPWDLLGDCIFSDLIFNVGNKLGTYPRVSIPCLSELVLCLASVGGYPCVSVSTYYLYVFL